MTTTCFSSTHIFFSLLKHGRGTNLDAVCDEVSACPAQLREFHSVGFIGEVISSYAKALPSPDANTVVRYCEFASEHREDSKEALRFLGRALETGAVAYAMQRLLCKYGAEVGAEDCKGLVKAVRLRKLLESSGPQVLEDVQGWMRTYQASFTEHARSVAATVKNLCALRAAAPQVYKVLRQVMTPQQPLACTLLDLRLSLQLDRSAVAATLADLQESYQGLSLASSRSVGSAVQAHSAAARRTIRSPRNAPGSLPQTSELLATG